MVKKITLIVVVILAISALTVGSTGPARAQSKELKKVSVVLQWVTQAQFAGYYAALDLGYYKDYGLDVKIVPGGPDISADQLVAAGQAEFGVRPFVTTLAAREGGADFVSLARVNQVPPTLLVSFKKAGITKPEQLKGRKVGSWLGGNEMEQFALLRQFKIEPDKDVTIIKQGFDMSQLINGEVEVAQATIYNEYAQILETVNPDTGKLYTPDDFNVISVRDYGINTLQDNIFARESWLAKAGNEDTALAFVEATLKGWIYCRDNVEKCVDIVLKSGSTLGKSHQMWMLNEFNNLIWPAPNGIGILNKESAFKDTAETAKTYKLITKDPDPKVFRTDIVEKAVKNLKTAGLDVNGANYKKQTVVLNKGGE